MEEDIKKLFGKVWPKHVMSLTRFLIDCRKSFDGDLDMFLVLAVIGERTFSARHADPGLTYETFSSGKAAETVAIDINIRSIADYSGIPRETVRRKISQLVEKGWVSRGVDGSLVATRKASLDLEPLTLASIRYLAGMMSLMKEMSPTPDGAA